MNHEPKNMKIALIGYGKMGQTIEQLAIAAGHQVVLKIDKDNTDALTEENLRKADVAIEFSQPGTAFDNITFCFKAGIPVVSGTTAWLDQFEEAVEVCKKEEGAFFYASNFSIGVNIFFSLSEYLAKMMDPYAQYEVSMEEIHHTQKLDAPSGTAVTLAEGIIKELNRKSKWQSEGADNESVIPIYSKRIDKVPGTHHVKYHSDIDEIEIVHTAKSREGFARGALSAAEWLVGKKGVFGMKDMLGIGL
jgi:4-hydroxy-tetrahydrodipicolinate reductase